MKTVFVTFLAIVGPWTGPWNAALANAPAPPPTPVATVMGNSVEICIRNASCEVERMSSFMRVDASGNVVQFDDASCKHDQENWSACYLDECVPPGVYRYGYLFFRQCNDYYPEVTLYALAEVTQGLAACERTGIGDPPEPTEAGPMWVSMDPIEYCDPEGGCSVSGSHSSELVMAGQILVVLLGLVLFARQRRRS